MSLFCKANLKKLPVDFWFEPKFQAIHHWTKSKIAEKRLVLTLDKLQDISEFDPTMHCCFETVLPNQVE